MGRDGANVQTLADNALGRHPRWSPDDRSIAFNDSTSPAFDQGVWVVRSNGRDLRRIAHGEAMNGVAWLPDGTGLVYSSSSGSTVLYPPMFNLWVIRLDGSGDRPLTFGDVSYTHPDVQPDGRVAATRTRIQSDIWRFPIGGSPEENTRQAVPLTRQTGQAQAPSASPDGREIVYLSDNGGHGNLWIATTDGSKAPWQVTFERDPAVAIGSPTWSRDGSRISFIHTAAGNTEQWVVAPDGSNPRRLLERGVSVSWSADGRWIYYIVTRQGAECIEKVLVDGGTPVSIRCGRVNAPAVTADGSTMYFNERVGGANQNGWDYQMWRASPETAKPAPLARIVSARVPFNPALFSTTLSPDGRWIAMVLTDAGTSNVWVLPTGGGPLRPITDYGTRATLIVRHAAWAPDSKSVYAAVADVDADIVLIDNLLR